MCRSRRPVRGRERRGRRDDALAELKLAVDYDPGHGASWVAMARLLTRDVRDAPLPLNGRDQRRRGRDDEDWLEGANWNSLAEGPRRGEDPPSKTTPPREHTEHILCRSPTLVPGSSLPEAGSGEFDESSSGEHATSARKSSFGPENPALSGPIMDFCRGVSTGLLALEASRSFEVGSN